MVAKASVTHKPPSKFRWVVLGIIFTTYAINCADRSNIGVLIPFLKEDFPISNFEAGAIASFFFLGYAISQIPAGLFYGKFGIRSLATASICGFSLVTFLLGTVNSIASMKWLRLALGLTEGPTPVGMVSTINNWFPPQEKATATGWYIGSTMFAPIVVPPLAVWIAVTFGWRWVFYSFAIPGFIMALVWYLKVANKPSESPYCDADEVAYIEGTTDGTTTKSAEFRDLGWIDTFIRAKEVAPIDTVKKIFTSWNIIGNTLAYFFMVCVLQGLLAWIPSYLVTGKGYSFMKMGLVAASPWIGGFLGAIIGGWLSDKVFNGRRKPTMLITAFATFIMMLVLIKVPEDVTLVTITLFFVGFMINIGWPAFTAYPMGVASKTTYPTAIAVVNSGGNLGGFFSPMIAGALLDAFQNYNLVFGYFAGSAVVGFILIMTLAEPINRSRKSAA